MKSSLTREILDETPLEIKQKVSRYTNKRVRDYQQLIEEVEGTLPIKKKNTKKFKSFTRHEKVSDSFEY